MAKFDFEKSILAETGTDSIALTHIDLVQNMDETLAPSQS